MADNPNNIQKNYKKYNFKYVCIQSCGDRSLSKYLTSCLLREFKISNAKPQT